MKPDIPLPCAVGLVRGRGRRTSVRPVPRHISRRQDKMWQVKFAKGKRAIKIFNTQAEAIVFAKKLAKSQVGSIRIHSLKGRIRKTI